MMDLKITPNWHVAKLNVRDSSLTAISDTELDEASLCVLSVKVNGSLITRIVDEEQQPHDGPRVSAFRFAEWLIWNWWRLRWEPTRTGQDIVSWRQAHETSSIGGGWLWPKITFESDGETVCVRSAGSEATVTEPITFVVDDSERFISAEIFEERIDAFLKSVLTRFKRAHLANNPLSDMWKELQSEREHQQISAYRRLEALLGSNPGEGDSEVIQQLIEDREVLGDHAADELAAEIPESSGVSVTAENLLELANRSGFRVRDEDLVKSPRTDETKQINKPNRFGMVAPWQIGQEAAKSLRVSQKLGDGRITNPVLSEMCGLPKRALTKKSKVKPPISFTLTRENCKQFVIRARVSEGRRFDAARLLADKLLVQNGESLQPATSTHTYRQKMQRAFAAELLCPFDSLMSRLEDDYSEESIEAAGKYFMVSPMLVASTLENNGITDSRTTKYARV